MPKAMLWQSHTFCGEYGSLVALGSGMAPRANGKKSQAGVKTTVYHIDWQNIIVPIQTRQPGLRGQSGTDWPGGCAKVLVALEVLYVKFANRNSGESA
jgi:hypothetical protein